MSQFSKTNKPNREQSIKLVELARASQDYEDKLEREKVSTKVTTKFTHNSIRRRGARGRR